MILVLGFSLENNTNGLWVNDVESYESEQGYSISPEVLHLSSI